MEPNIVLAVVLAHQQEYKRRLKEAIDNDDQATIDACMTSYTVVNGILADIQQTMAAIAQQKQEETSAKNTQLNEGANSNKTEGGNENGEG